MSTRRRGEGRTVEGGGGRAPPAAGRPEDATADVEDEGECEAASHSQSAALLRAKGEVRRAERWRQEREEGEAQAANHRRRERRVVGGSGALRGALRGGRGCALAPGGGEEGGRLGWSRGGGGAGATAELRLRCAPAPAAATAAAGAVGNTTPISRERRQRQPALTSSANTRGSRDAHDGDGCQWMERARGRGGCWSSRGGGGGGVAGRWTEGCHRASGRSAVATVSRILLVHGGQVLLSVVVVTVMPPVVSGCCSICPRLTNVWTSCVGCRWGRGRRTRTTTPSSTSSGPTLSRSTCDEVASRGRAAQTRPSSGAGTDSSHILVPSLLMSRPAPLRW